MKKIILMMPFLAGFLITSYGQDISMNDVPADVQNTFQKQYSNATDIDWEKKGQLYEAEFDKDGSDWEVRLDQTGKVIREKKDIDYNELPDKIKDALKTGYKDYSVDDLDQITENNQILYKVELENKTEEIKLWFDKEGQTVTRK
jgi:uncharacterized membrane protein YkoI